MSSLVRRITRLSTAVGAAGLLIASLSPLAAQSGAIEVVCTDSEGTPLNKVEVTARALKSGTVSTKKTDKRGSAVIKKLPADIYMIWARLEGYEPALHEFLSLGADAEETVKLVFQPGDSTKQMYFENPQLSSQGNQLLMEGFEALRDGKLEEGEEKLKASLAIQESSPDAHHNLGLLYLRTQRWDEAEAALKRASELFDVYMAVNPTGKEQLEIRRDGAQTALDSLPMQKVAYEADVAMEAKDFDKAIGIYNKLIEMAPDNANVYYNRAVAEAHAERLDEAKVSIDKAIQLKSDDNAFQELKKQILQIEESGQSLRAQNAIEEIQKHLSAEEFEPALEKLNAALAEMPDKYHATFQRMAARAHRGLGHADQAIESYRSAIEADPLPETRRELAEYLFEQERYEEGVKAYAKVFEAESQPAAKGYHDLGKAFSRQGKQDVAAMLYQAALAADNSFSAAHYDLGMYYYYQKSDKAKAKGMLERFIELGGDAAQIDNAKAVLIVIERSK